MAKLQKTRKKTADEIRFIKCIQDHLNQYYAKSNLIKNIEYSENSLGDFLCFIAKLDYGSFTQMIEYCPTKEFKQNYIDVNFFFKNSENIYTFYDIFNLFDIDDFNLYYYEDVLSVGDVENALNEILNATDAYFHYFVKAQTPEYLPQLEKNYREDMCNAYGSEDWKEEKDEEWFAPINHPINTFADGQITPKMIEELKELDAEDGLATIYERRLLKYLESNPDFTRKNLLDKENFEKLYKRAFIKTLGIAFIIPMVAVFALTYLIHALVFRDAVIPESQVKISFCMIAAVMFAIIIMVSLGKMLVAKDMPEEMRERAKAEYIRSQNKYQSTKKPNKFLMAAACVILAFFATILFFGNLSDVGYYENGVKILSFPNELREVPYEELEICKVQGYYDKNNEFRTNENSFALLYNGDEYFLLDDIKPDGEAQKKLEEIAEKYGKEIKEIKTIDELYENSES